MPRRSAAAVTASRDAVVSAAVRTASVDGLEGLTIGRLAGELDMSKSGLFGHFGSKEDLQIATIERAGRRFISRVVEPAYRETADGSERLRALVNGYIDHMDEGIFPGG